MTHPLTPREKVAAFLAATEGRGLIRQEGHTLDPADLRAALASAPLTPENDQKLSSTRVDDSARASGSGDQLSRNPGILKSGDHAELARLARKAREQMTCEATTDALCDGVDTLPAESAALRAACAKSNDEISQTLGKALGYPWFKDDQTNFPGSTEADGVCVGEHVAESLADEAARRLTQAVRQRDEVLEALGSVQFVRKDNPGASESYLLEETTRIARKALASMEPKT